jgi:hypothetical protein
MKPRLIGATVLTLALAAPAIAGDAQGTAATQRAKRQVRTVPHQPNSNNFYDPNLPVENALRWGYSQGYSNYPSGFGGLYGDGRYPGNVISNKNYPTWW